MQKRIGFLLALFMFMNCCAYANFSLDCLELQSEFLYFKPTLDQSHYVISSTNNRFGGNVYPDGRRHMNHSRYSPGFRVGASYSLCCENAIDARFTQLRSHHSNSVSGPFLFDTIGYPGDGAQFPEDTTYEGTARSHRHFRYYAGDLNLSRLTFSSFCPENLSFFIGLHYAHIRVKEHFDSVGTGIDGSTVTPVSNHLTRQTKFWGIGPQFGIDYHYDFTCLGDGLLSLTANGRTALLCSNTHARFRYVTTRTGPVGVNIHNDSLWRVTPTVDARLGLSYKFCVCCTEVKVEGGYEFIWYHHCFDGITGLDVAYAGDTIDLYSNLNLHGPYLSLQIAF